MAFSRKHKEFLVAQYEQWLKESQGVFLLSFNKMAMKDIDAFRTKVREAGGESHVVKNTLFHSVLQSQGYHTPNMEGTTLVVLARTDAPAIAKLMVDSTVKSEIFAIKGGFLGTEYLTIEQVKALAELPPLPIMRAKLLGVLQAHASQLVRTLVEPARSLAAVFKAYSEKEAAPAAG